MSLRTYKTEGIVIKRINYGEADKILTLFSKHYGKISCLAKGVRKLTSRKSASLELFNLAVVFLAKGKSLDIITESEIKDSFSSWRRNLDKVALAYKFCELTSYLSAERQKNILVFELLRQSLEKLNLADVDQKKLELEFKQKILEHTGFGLPKIINSQSLDDHIEEIIERRINSCSLLKRIAT